MKNKIINMENLKKTNVDQEKKKVFINIGKVARGGGGGIGAVILLGGVLATAAFASAFIVRKKGRGSGNNSHRNTHKPPPPVAVNKENEQDEANKGQLFTSLDTSLIVNKHPSETTKEIEIKNGTQSLVLDEKPRTEINGKPLVAVCDSEQILCSITPKVQENNVIYDGSVTNKGEFHLPVLEEKIQSRQEDTIDEITKECNGFKKVNAEEKQAEGESRGDGEISGVKCEEAIEETKVDVAGIGFKLSEEGICGNREVMGCDTSVPEIFVSESHCNDGQESILPVFEIPVIKHENVNADKKQGFLSTEVVEIIHEDEAVEEGEEDQVKHIEEQLFKEYVEEIIPQKCEERNDDQQNEVNNKEKIPCQNNEEKSCTDNPTPEDRQFGDCDKDVQILTMSIPEEAMIFPKDIEVSKEDAANEEEVICQQKDPKDEVMKNIEKEVEDLSETIDTGIATAKDESVEEDLSDEGEQNSEGTEDSSMESNVGVVWPVEAIQESFIETQQVKLINQEMEGKIQEDTTVKQGKHELHHQVKAEECNSNKIIADSTHITSNGKGNSAKAFIEKYVVDLATLKDYSTSSITRRMLVAIIPVLSSLSCSWFFGLSFDKLCFVVLLTIVLSKSMIFE